MTISELRTLLADHDPGAEVRIALADGAEAITTVNAHDSGDVELLTQTVLHDRAGRVELSAGTTGMHDPETDIAPG